LSRLSLQGLTGMAVLVAGLISLHAATTPAEEPVGQSPVTVGEPTSVAIEGVHPSVQRALRAYGSASFLTGEEMTELPEAVARTLIHHGVTLAVPSGGGQ
jgi:hypothetical protein